MRVQMQMPDRQMCGAYLYYVFCITDHPQRVQGQMIHCDLVYQTRILSVLCLCQKVRAVSYGQNHTIGLFIQQLGELAMAQRYALFCIVSRKQSASTLLFLYLILSQVIHKFCYNSLFHHLQFPQQFFSYNLLFCEKVVTTISFCN